MKKLAYLSLVLLGFLVALLPTESRAQATLLAPGEQCFSATTATSGGPAGTGTGFVGLLGTITAGSGGTNGTYGGVPLTGGSGSNATANITVSGGVVTAVAIVNPGVQYVVGDVLSATPSNIGNVSGFSVPIASVAINQSLAGGTVGYYVPSTQTPKQTWQNSAQTILNSNPVTLDGNGCAIVYGSGIYRQILKDSLGNTVWDQLTASTNSSNPVWAAQAGGTANAITVTDTSFAGTGGQIIQFIPLFQNTGPATLYPSSFGAIPIVNDTTSGPVALVGGELVPGNIVTVTYDSTNNEFHLLITTQYGAAQLGNSALGFNAPTNLQINASALSNQLTISLVGNNGSAPSTINPIIIPFRDATVSNGDPVIVKVTSALSFTIASGSTMGCVSTLTCRLWVFAINNGGTVALCAYNSVLNSAGNLSVIGLNEGSLQNSASGNIGGSSSQTLYCSTASLSSRAIRYLGYIDILESSAGTWASGPSRIQLFGPGISKPGEVVQRLFAATSASTACATSPTGVMSLTITPTNSADVIHAHANVYGVNLSNDWGTFQFGRNSPSNVFGHVAGSGAASVGIDATSGVDGFDLPNTTSATIYTIYCSSNAPSGYTVNASGGASGATSGMILEEIMSANDNFKMKAVG